MRYLISRMPFSLAVALVAVGTASADDQRMTIAPIALTEGAAYRDLFELLGRSLFIGQEP